MQKLKLPDEQRKQLLDHAQEWSLWQLFLLNLGMGLWLTFPECIPFVDDAFILPIFMGSMWTFMKRAWKSIRPKS